MDTTQQAIPPFQIFPAIGLARVGNSRHYSYLASEAPLIDYVPEGGYRPVAELAEGSWLSPQSVLPPGNPQPGLPGGGVTPPGPIPIELRPLKRMGCRFRIYEFDASGQPVREVTSANAQIEWTIQLVNKKAAGDADWGLGLVPGPLNVGPTAAQLTIDSGAQTISGTSQGPLELGGNLMSGTPDERYVKLGDIQTDARGRLIVLGGHGDAGTWDALFAPTAMRNRNWYDDISDGIVEARVTIGQQSYEALSARIVVGPPDYAHPCLAPVTLFDLAFDRSGGWGATVPQTSFRDHIHPILHRTAFLEFTLFSVRGMTQGRTPKHGHGYIANHDMHPDGAFFDSRVFPGLHTLDTSDPAFAEGERRRGLYFDMLKDPSGALPPLGQGQIHSMPAIEGLTYTPVQYQYFSDLAAGTFASDWPPGRDPADLAQPGFRDIPLAGRPAALNRASMDFAVGGPFYPGVEVGAVLDDPASYFRVGLPNAESDFRISDAIEPGDLTGTLAVPWQVGMNQHNYQHPTEASADNLWPSARPVRVAAKRSGVSDDMSWTRPLTQTGNPDVFENQKMTLNRDMIANWSKLGLLAPMKLYIETSRSLQEDPSFPI